MATIKRFEDIASWKKGRELTKHLYDVTRDGSFGKDWSFQSQIRRASVSVMSNIAEGFERGGDKSFRNFLSVAKGSAAEVRSHLYVALDVGYIDQTTFDRLYALAQDASFLIGGFMKYLDQKPDGTGGSPDASIPG
jgi:four helix bundle protein